jgi:hypothetical protein
MAYRWIRWGALHGDGHRTSPGGSCAVARDVARAGLFERQALPRATDHAFELLRDQLCHLELDVTDVPWELVVDEHVQSSAMRRRRCVLSLEFEQAARPVGLGGKLGVS